MIAVAVLVQTVTTDFSTELVADAVIRILGFGLLAGATAASAALVYRWYSAEEIADGVAILTGVAVVAAWLNTRTAVGNAIIGEEVSLLDPVTAVYTVSAFVVSAIAADGGRRVGDYLARDVFAIAAPRTIDQVSQLVRAAGRVVAVDLPETIEDADGYDPVPEETKTELAGTTLLFPRRLAAEELRERLIDRLERDYGVGHVDVELTVDGTVDVEYLALGSRPTGLGPTLAPGTVAVAIRADPAADASSGDAVQVWRVGGSGSDSYSHSNPSSDSNPDSRTNPDSRSSSDGETPTCVATAELRAATEDVATIALARDDALEALGDRFPGDDGGREDDRERGYRLVTLPGTPDAGRQFVSLLRAANETVTSVTVGAGGGDRTRPPETERHRERKPERSRDREGERAEYALEGASVGSLPVAVLAVERDGATIALPAADERLVVGDVAYLLGRPEAFRRLGATAGTGSS